MSGFDRALLVVFACLGLSWVGVAGYLLASRLLFDLRLGSLRTGRILLPAKLTPAPRPVFEPVPAPAPALAVAKEPLPVLRPALAHAVARAAAPVPAARPQRARPVRRKPVPVGAGAGKQLLQ